MRKTIIKKLVNLLIKVIGFSYCVVFLMSCNTDNKEASQEENQLPVFTRNHISDVKSNKLFERLAVEPQKFQINRITHLVIIEKSRIDMKQVWR